MSTGQKYRRTEFEDNDDNNSAGEANSPGVVYNPVIAFHAASFSGGRGGLIGRGCCARRSGLEKLLLAVVASLSVVVVVLLVMLGARGHSGAASSTQAVSSRLQAESPMTGGHSAVDNNGMEHEPCYSLLPRQEGSYANLFFTNKMVDDKKQRKGTKNLTTCNNPKTIFYNTTWSCT